MAELCEGAVDVAAAERRDLWDAVEEIQVETRGNPCVCVALLDGPVDGSHGSLLGATLTQLEGPVRTRAAGGAASRHGTHIASIIFGHDSGAVRGIAPGCRGVSIPIFADDGSVGPPACSQAHLAEAINLAVEAGAHVVNISAGEVAPTEVIDPGLLQAIRRCADAGVLVIAAAGAGSCDHPQIPSALPWVLAVGASRGAAEAPTRLSTALGVGSCVLAPVDAIPGAIAGGGIGLGSGTSYATAIVSGLAALLLSLQAEHGRGLDSRLVREVLATSVGGRLDPRDAVRRLRWTVGLGGSSYAIRPEALRERFGGVAAEKFGTVDIALPTGRSYNVPDLHYPVTPRRTGMRLVPVSDDGSGHHAIDALLRKEMGLGADDPIYALLGYVRPEEHGTDLFRLPHTTKLQLGHHHVAAYVGEGRTTHVLGRKTKWKGSGPLDMKWNVDRSPATVHTVSLHGVPQATLNRNAHITDGILAAGGKEPEDTQNVRCRTIDINTTLQYYRDCIRGAEYLEDLSWFTNCAVHKTAVVNLALNLPHNETAFEDIFGEDGGHLWVDFKRRYEDIGGEPFAAAAETHFTPLWRLAGLAPQQIRPLSFGEYNAYHTARAEGWLDEYTGRKPMVPGAGLAWPLETVVDLVGSFMRTYVPFDEAGGLAAAVELLVLRKVVQDKLAVTDELYLQVVSPLVTKLLVAEALARKARDPRWLESAAAELCDWLGAPDGSLRTLIEQCVEAAQEEFTDVPEDGRGIAERLSEALGVELDRVRTTVLGREDPRIGFFSSPAIFHQLALGLHPTSPFVTVRNFCTVMDAAELMERPPMRPSREGVRVDEQPSLLREAADTRQVQLREGGEPAAAHSALVTPRADGAEPSAGAEQLVYALGRLAYDFPSRARRDSIKQKMDASAQPEQPADILAYLDSNPFDAPALQWTLDLEATPIYVIEPRGAFARDAYDLLRQFLREEIEEGVERISVPGVISGVARHRSGETLPVVVPAMRGMYSWTTEALVSSVVDATEVKKASEREKLQEGVTSFLERVYYEVRNLGREPHERALNFAATNAFEAEQVFERAISENLELDSIEVEASPVCPPGADCWDVKLMFFFPQREVQTVRKAYRFTVDLADVVPATVGPMRSWFIR